VLWARQFEALRRPVMAARLMLVEGRVQKSPEGVVHLMASHIIDRSDALDLMWDAHRAGSAFPKSLLAPADEGSTLGLPGNGRDARHSVIPPPVHLAPPPRNRHPRDARILPKSRDFH
jgi:error-prone DNA polymerase